MGTEMKKKKLRHVDNTQFLLKEREKQKTNTSSRRSVKGIIFHSRFKRNKTRFLFVIYLLENREIEYGEKSEVAFE